MPQILHPGGGGQSVGLGCRHRGATLQRFHIPSFNAREKRNPATTFLIKSKEGQPTTPQQGKTNAAELLLMLMEEYPVAIWKLWEFELAVSAFDLPSWCVLDYELCTSRFMSSDHCHRGPPSCVLPLGEKGRKRKKNLLCCFFSPKAHNSMECPLQRDPFESMSRDGW